MPPRFDAVKTGVMAAPEVVAVKEYCENDQLWPSAIALIVYSTFVPAVQLTRVTTPAFAAA